MELIIDVDDPIPIFTQLINQIKTAVAKNVLNAGDPLPSIRQLANDLDVNQKTVAKAYRLLERDAVIQTKGYRGTFIHPDAKKNCEINITEWTDTVMQDAVEKLRAGGVTDSEIRISFNNVMNNRIGQGD